MPFHMPIAAGILVPLLAATPLPVAHLSTGTLPASQAPVPVEVATAESALPPSTPEIIDLSVDGHRRMTVPVRIGGTGPFEFLIDTGAERTILSRAVAARLGLAATNTATLVGVAGSQVVDIVEVEEMNLGRRSFYGLVAPVLEGHFIGADGIVGLDSLQDQRVLLDFAANRMTVEDADAPGRNKGYDIVVRARSRSGQLIMADARVDGVPTQVIIDTGANTSIGNLALQRALARRRAHSRTELISVTGQTVAADMGLASTMELGGMKLANTMLAFTDAPAFHKLKMARKPAMLLGMDQLRLFRRVAIDFSAKRILFDLPAAGPKPPPIRNVAAL